MLRRLLLPCLALLGNLAVAQTPALPSNVEFVETFRGVSQYRLKSNGMPILVMENHASPVFTFMVVYHVGSRNEAPGNTGSAHLLEHMIFNKSTANFGKANGHKTFQEVLYEAGADYTSTNMTTWCDRMNGYSTLPPDKLELAIRIEADRLNRGLILDSERQSEMSVVRNEYEIGENNPNQALFKAVVAAAIQAHPYHWSTIGYRSDIEGVTTEKLREHYKTFFHPNNAEAILVGDFDTAQALALFDREFGGFPKSPHPIPQVITVEPPQQGERRAIVRRPGTVGLVEIGYIRPGASHPDFAALEVLAVILGQGVNSRLYQALVDKQLAADVNVDNLALRDPFPLLFTVTNAPGKTHEEVERALKSALALVAEQGVTAEEVTRAQRQLEVDAIRNRDGAYAYTRTMGEAVASADWKWFLTYVDRANAVTADDVKRVAAQYLVPDHATVGWFVPTPNAAKPAAVANATAAASANPSPASPPPVVAATESRPTTPSVASTPTASFATRTTRKVLANGITVDVVENHANATVAIRGLFFSGEAFAAGGNRAVPDLTARMLQRGTTTKTKEQIGALLDAVGASRFYSNTLAEAGVSLNGLSRDLPRLLDVLADELRNPAFNADEFAKTKAELKTAILRNDDNTSVRAIERLSQLAYPEGHPYRAPGATAMVANIEAATLDDLRAFHRAHYNGASLVLAIVGDVDAAKTVALVEQALGSLPQGQRAALDAPRTSPQAAAREAITMRGKANMNIVLGSASGLRRTDPMYEAALIGNAALGQSSLASRIGRRVRDTEGLSYALSSRYTYSDLLDGLWLVNVNVAPQNLAKALASTRDEIAKFAREGITDEEVQVQKNFFAANFQVGLGTNAGVASALNVAEKFGFGPKYLDEYPQRFRAVTREQVNAALQRHFFADKLHVIVAGDLETLPD